MAQHNQLGRKGEDLAVDYLVQQGHTIVARNYRHNRAEIDIISTHNSVTVFTEVKTRTGSAFGHPEEAVSKTKRRLIQHASEEYLASNNVNGNIRFDVISITFTKGKPEVYHIQDAFTNYDEQGRYF